MEDIDVTLIDAQDFTKSMSIQIQILAGARKLPPYIRIPKWEPYYGKFNEVGELTTPMRIFQLDLKSVYQVPKYFEKV